MTRTQQRGSCVAAVQVYMLLDFVPVAARHDVNIVFICEVLVVDLKGSYCVLQCKPLIWVVPKCADVTLDDPTPGRTDHCSGCQLFIRAHAGSGSWAEGSGFRTPPVTLCLK